VSTPLNWADATLVGLIIDGSVYLSEIGRLAGNPRPGFRDAQALDVNLQAWIVATSHGVYRSTDAGRSWKLLIGHTS
jgi:hypothetical protein